MTNDLQLYFESNCDRLIHKWMHYFEIYDRHFSRFRQTDVHVVEIGVSHGGSLQMWRHYFGSQAKIIGVDIDPRCQQLQEEGIEIIIGDQADLAFLTALKDKVPRIDILIDDGGHTMSQQINTFEVLFPHISEFGVYLCEDLHTSYWSEYSGGLHQPNTFIEFSKQWIDHLNAWHSREPERFGVSDFTKTANSMHYYDSILVIEKRPMSPPIVRMTGTPTFITPMENLAVVDTEANDSSNGFVVAQKTTVTRVDKILYCIEPASQRGIEIGALISPIVTPDMGDIRYVDHETTEGLRKKYSHDPNVDVSKIVEVDYVWGVQSLPELVGVDAPFDYVVASHVIEHVPDFIGWLKEIRAVLKPGGILTLAIPDKRFCFDYCRQLTQPAEVIEAFLRKSRKPSLRQIFDFFSSVVCREGAFTWVSEVNPAIDQLTPMHSDEDAWKLTSQALAEDTYIDVHCWVFTPHSFFELLRALIQLELIDFKVAQFFETIGCEFYVSLQALDPEMPLEERQRTQLESLPKQSSGDPHSLVWQTKIEVQQLRIELKREMEKSSLSNQHLQQVQTELREMREQLQDARQVVEHIDVDLKQSNLRLHQKRALVKRLRTRLKRMKNKLKRNREELHQIKTSKFWMLQNFWWKFKGLFQ